MVKNDKGPLDEEAKTKATLEESAHKLAEMVLRAYKREQAKKGDIENGRKND